MMHTARNSKDNINVEVSVPHLLWKTLDFAPETVACDCTRAALSFAVIPDDIASKSLEISISLVSDKMIQTLNCQYRNMDEPTNVLSFAARDIDTPSAAEECYLLGDIVLGYETIAREAREQHKSFHDHFSHMVIHGLLHLLGYDHENDEDAKTMETLEIKIINTIGIKNPYE